MTKILIVDDEKYSCSFRRDAGGEGYRVRAFDNPLKALELLRTRIYLAIFDIKMPEEWL